MHVWSFCPIHLGERELMTSATYMTVCQICEKRQKKIDQMQMKYKNKEGKIE